MTPDEAKALLSNPEFQAFADGKQIQKELRGKWEDETEISSTEIVALPNRFRIKSEPREWWINVYGHGQAHTCFLCKSKAEADLAAASDRTECLHVREVLPSTESA